MRTITEIKESMIDYFVNDVAAAKAYGFAPGSEFKKHFSNVSVESILFYIFACAAWVLERLFAEHRSEIDARIDTLMPHRPKWYRDKVLAFMYNRQLIPYTDEYDLTGLSEADIERARIVKHAVATESRDTSILTIKVAGGDVERCPLTEYELIALDAYIAEIKDAGVRINLVSKDADIYNCDVDIYYNAMIIPEVVKDDAENAIKKYIVGLPFNGEYTNMALIDALQEVAGVKIAELKNASRQDGGGTPIAINARCVPSAGYFAPGVININTIAYEQV